MSTETVCRVCLVVNMNLYNVQNDLQNVYERIVREKFNKVGYPVHMCYICLTVLRKCHRFMETARGTNNVLKQWYNQQNEIPVARQLYTYSISKAELVSTYNGNIMLQNDIKVEEVKPEQEEVQAEYPEYNTVVDIEKIDIDEQTDYSKLLVDSPTDTIEDNDRQTDSLFDNKIKETSGIASNLDDHTQIETTVKTISPHDNGAHSLNKRETNETKPKLQALETSGETATNSETTNDTTLFDTSPSQQDNIRHRKNKAKLTFDKYNRSSKGTARLCKVVKTNVIQKKNERKAINSKRNRNNFNKPCNTSITEKNEINTCNYKTTVKRNTRDSKRSSDEKQFICDICNHKSKQKVNLESHLRTHTGEKPYLCDICEHKFSRKYHLKTHKRTHTGEKPYSCDDCDYKCIDNSSLKKHFIRVHENGGTPFSCDICYYKSYLKGALKRHMMTHTGENPFSCEICGYKSKQKVNLESHLRTHTGEKPYSCDICEHKFSRKCHLKTHKRTHTGEKPFSCDICGLKFIDKGSLKKHKVRFHSNKKLFSCDVCEYKCVEKSTLKKHTRIHTGEKPFTCDICNFKCSYNNSLKRHLLTKHVNIKRK